MRLSKEQAKEFLYGQTSPDAPGFEREADEPLHEKRWTMVHQLVLKDTAGLYWATTYERGLTESQYIDPFEYDPDEIEFELVEKVPVTTYEYRAVKP